MKIPCLLYRYINTARCLLLKMYIKNFQGSFYITVLSDGKEIHSFFLLSFSFDTQGRKISLNTSRNFCDMIQYRKKLIEELIKANVSSRSPKTKLTIIRRLQHFNFVKWIFVYTALNHFSNIETDVVHSVFTSFRRKLIFPNVISFSINNNIYLKWGDK